MTTPGSRHNYPHFRDEETKVWRDQQLSKVTQLVGDRAKILTQDPCPRSWLPCCDASENKAGLGWGGSGAVKMYTLHPPPDPPIQAGWGQGCSVPRWAHLAPSSAPGSSSRDGRTGRRPGGGGATLHSSACPLSPVRCQTACWRTSSLPTWCCPTV